MYIALGVFTFLLLAAIGLVSLVRAMTVRIDEDLDPFEDVWYTVPKNNGDHKTRLR